MALKQSAWALGNQVSVRPQTAGCDHTQRFTFEVDVLARALAIGDIVEIGELPSYCVITAVQVFTEGTWTGATADIGLMSGEYGLNDAARTSGNQLFAAADLTAFNRLVKPECLLLPFSELPRGIGIKIAGAAVAQAAGKRIHLVLTYRQ